MDSSLSNLCVVIALLIAPVTCFCQHQAEYIYLAQAAKEDTYEANKVAKLQELKVGDKYWIAGTGRTGWTRRTNESICPERQDPCRRPIVIWEHERFEIVELAKLPSTEIWIGIRFESGRVGYIAGDNFYLMLPEPADELLSNTLEQRMNRQFICSEHPEEYLRKMREAHKAEDDRTREESYRRDAEIRKEMERRRAEEVRERKARGGVSIGMTKEQVLRSQWGTPTSINRTITSGVLFEQWVFGAKQILYFENNRVTMIQQFQ